MVYEDKLENTVEPVNIEEMISNSNKESLELTELQKKYINSCTEDDGEYKLATLIESNYYIGSLNQTPYIVMRYNLDGKDIYYEDNFYLSENAYKHNLERLERNIAVLDGKLSLQIMENHSTLVNYLNSLKGKQVMIQQFINSNGHKLYNIKKTQLEVI